VPIVDDNDDADDDAEVFPPVKLAIFARRVPSPEPQCDRFRAEALRRGHEVRDADVAAFVSGSLAVDIAGPMWIGGVRVDDVDAVILGPLPGPAARTSPPGVSLSSEEHALRTTRQVERHALAWSIVIELEARGVPVLSSPTRSRPFDLKPAQLMALARAGLPVPPTRFTDHDDAAAAAADVIDKPIAGGPVRAGGGVVAAGAPVIRQQRVRGVDLRAVVVGENVVALARFPGDDDVIDLRERPGFQDGSVKWQRDDDDVAAVLALRAARICACDFAAVDLKRQGRAVTVLEVNRTPVVLDIEDDTGVPVSSLFIDLVEERAGQRGR
jgi:hypothetical protein